jgi:hypothetical protein
MQAIKINASINPIKRVFKPCFAHADSSVQVSDTTMMVRIPTARPILKVLRLTKILRLRLRMTIKKVAISLQRMTTTTPQSAFSRPAFAIRAGNQSTNQPLN